MKVIMKSATQGALEVLIVSSTTKMDGLGDIGGET